MPALIEACLTGWPNVQPQGTSVVLRDLSLYDIV